MGALLAGHSWDMSWKTRNFVWDVEGIQPPSVPASQCLGENDQNKLNLVLLPASKHLPRSTKVLIKLLFAGVRFQRPTRLLGILSFSNPSVSEQRILCN